MITRFNLLSSQPETARSTDPDKEKLGRSRSYLRGWFILTAMTTTFVAWLGYRWLAQPTWPHRLPSVVGEAFALVQIAAAFTLLFLWAGLIWRHRSRQTRANPMALSLSQLYALSPYAFEKYVADLFRSKGYRVELRGGSGDHGVDLELFGPKGRRAIVQCKRYLNTVGEDTVRDLYGTLLHERASRAFLVTSAEISDPARAWAEGKPITLIDGETLVRIAFAVSEASRQQV